MYDLEIIVPAELNNDNIVQRFKDFRKWGLINHEGVKVKLYFLASFDNHPSDLNILCARWPENFDVEGVITPYKHVAQRIMYYYTDVMKPDTARWYVRIDEDSRTDVSGLLRKMDEWFDHTREYHVVGEVSKEVQDIEYKILTSLGYNWYDEIQGHDIHQTAPVHEIEISLTSNAAVNRILGNPEARNFLEMRREFSEGQGDHAFVFAARLSKIYPTSVKFVTRNPRAIEFSLYGGQYYHIHDISRDRHGEYLKWLELTDGNENPELEAEIKKNNYFLEYSQGKHWVSFDENRKIAKKSPVCTPEWSTKSEPVGIWGFTKEGKLTGFITHEFYRNDPPITFEKIHDGFDSVTGQKMTLRFSNEEKKKKLMI